MSTAEAGVTNRASGRTLRGLAHLGEWLSDRFNPIVVKELRQAVRSWVALAMLVFYLVIQLLVIGIMLMTEVESIMREQPVGTQVFCAVQVQLVIATVGLLPLYAGVRLFLERSDVNLDLMFITPLRPVWLVLGKLCAAVVLGLLFFSASAPVMVMAYFLRGLDLLTATILLGLDLIMMIAVVQLALFVAAIPVPRPVGVLLGIGVLAISWGLTLTLWELADRYLSPSGLPGLFWLPALSLAATAIFSAVLLFTATHALLSPPSSNRLLALKVALLFAPPSYFVGMTLGSWFIGLMTGGVPFTTAIWSDLLIDFVILMEKFGPVTFSILSWLAWGMATSERLTWGPRLLAQVPRSRWLRVLVFPFYTGAPNGIVFASLLTGIRWLLLIAIASAASIRNTHGAPLSDGGPLLSEFGGIPGWFIQLFADLYIIGHALTALWLRRFLERSWGKSPPGWLLIALTVGLLSFISVLGAVIGSLMDLPDRVVSLCFLLAPFSVLEAMFGEVLLHNERGTLYVFASIVVMIAFVIVALVTLAWWVRQVRLFRPPQLAQPMTQPETRSSVGKEQ